MKKPDDGGVGRVVVATGIASVAVQLVFIREYLSQFQGNEIVIALIFFCWLVFGGIGTVAAKRLQVRILSPSPQTLALLSCVLAILSVVQVAAVRRMRDVVFIHGASVGFYPTLGFIAATVLPYALLVGYVLPYSLFVIRNRSPRYPGSWIYMADNAGDVAGGALFSFALVPFLTPFQVLLVVHLPLLVSLLRLESAFSRRVIVGGICAILILMAGVIFESHLLPVREGRRVHYAESRYGRIEVTESGGQVTLFADGVPHLSSHNPALAEETVHFPLSQVDRVSRLLLVSVVGGMMEEVAKYEPDKVDYVELDPLAAEIQFRFKMVTPIDGLTLVSQDARAYLTHTTAVYDAVLVNLPEPETFQVNRFYTAGFFTLVKAHLAAGGVFSFGVNGVANYLSTAQREKLSSLANTALAFFKHVVLLPGEKVFFICSDRPIRRDIPELLARKGVDTRHIQRYFSGDVTEQRIRQLNHAVDPDIPLNLDLSPQLMRLVFAGWFNRHGESPLWFALVSAGLALVYLFRINRLQWVLMTTGCLNIGAEMLAIFTFQVLYGYIYLQIGMMVTVFLAGLLPGAWAGGRFTGSRHRALMISDLLLCLLVASFALILITAWQGLPVICLYGFGLTLSFCCGFQFPLVLSLLGDDDAAATGSFSADLVGAAIGVLLVSLILIPFMGLVGTALTLAGIKFISFLISGSLHGTA